MRFGKSATTVLIAAVVVVVAFTSFVSNLISHRMAASFEDDQFELIAQIMRSRLAASERRAVSAAESVAAIPTVRKAFAARDRGELLAVTRDAFAVQREKYGISQAQFHLAPAVSFLRIHNPDRHGENLSSYRQIVVEVNQARAVRKGLEITTSGIGVFGTVPMTDDAGQAIGSFEMALEIESVLDEIKKDHGVDVGFFVDEALLRKTATSLKGDVFNDQNRVGSLLRFHATHPNLLRPLVTDADINVTQVSHYVRVSAGVPYGVQLQPVYNFARQQVGVLAVAKSFAATRSADTHALIWQTLLGITAIVVLSGLVLIVIRGMLMRPLERVGEQLTVLADGGVPDAALAEPACDEIRQLADACRALRDRRAADAAAAGAP